MRTIKILLIVILISLVIQTSFVVVSIQKITNLEQDLSNTKKELTQMINFQTSETDTKLSELGATISQTEINLNKQISTLEAQTSADFSGLIEDVIVSVVSIRTNAAQGTGFLITNDGYIITNAHVLSEAVMAEATTSEGKRLRMSLIGYDQTLDLALLKIDGEYNELTLANSDNIRVGEKVIAIGNPQGLSFSVSEGIISAVDRRGPNNIPAYIQIDAALNPGNSGGPLINTKGEVIGMNNFKISGESLGFALESNFIKQIVNDIAQENLNRTLIS